MAENEEKPRISGLQNNSIRFSIRTMLVAFIIVACVLWAGRFVYRTLQTPFEAYAMWDGACLVIDHLRTHNEQWPKSWDELSSTLAKAGGLTRNSLSISDLQQRLIIDFEAEPKQLMESALTDSRPEFRVVRLRNGRDIYWVNAEPNTLIYEYLTNPTELLASGNYHSQIGLP